MRRAGLPTTECFAIVIRECLERGEPVHIDDLGSFLPDADRGFRFIPDQKQRVFIAYVQEDALLARRLYGDIAASGFNPWLDKKKLLPGQNWPRAIESAIESSDFFIPCFSRDSVSKRGTFHSELRFAIECASLLPLDETFIIPVRLNECIVPRSLQAHIQYVDLFPDWRKGVGAVVEAMRRQTRARVRNRR